MAITDWPDDQRPRERLLEQGAAALAEAEKTSARGLPPDVKVA